MSHFYTMVLVPSNITEELEAESYVAELLHPYDENKEVDPYERTCWCVKHNASEQADKQVDEEFGKLDPIREQFNKEWGDTGGEDWEERQEAWSKLIKPRINRYEELKAEYMKTATRDPECDECNEEGIYTSTYNPKSKWDWWVIGGRWSGVLDDYNPAEDPQNIEKCWLCHGTGIRETIDAMKKDQGELWNSPGFSEASQKVKKLAAEMQETGNINIRETMEKVAEEVGGLLCNSCGGAGMSVKWPSEQTFHAGNIMPVKKLLELDPETFVKKTGYAVVTPDGEWHERGEMGWFGISSCEVDSEQWDEAVKVILEMNQECNVVVVDCHI